VFGYHFGIAEVGRKKGPPLEKPARFALLFAGVSMLCACVTVQWRVSVQGPAIAQLDAVRALGIAVFDPVLKSNDHQLIGVGGAFTNPIDLDGVSARVALLVLAPDAASKYSANRESLSRACCEVWVNEIGAARPFDYALSRGARGVRVLGQTPDGRAVPNGYDAVRAVPEPLGRAPLSAAFVTDLCRRHQVDALLGVEPSVYAEVGQVSSQESDRPFGKDVDPGNFVLRAQVSYEYVLYDGESGAAITDSSTCRPQYDTRLPPETWIVDMGPSNPQAILGFLKGPGFLGALAQSMREACKPYLTLFRSCAIAVPGR
jgi:hypothetical protein